MTAHSTKRLLDDLLDSWDRNNTILVNLLRSIAQSDLVVKATASGPSVAQMFTHIHYVRLVFLSEDVPESAQPLPVQEWASEYDRDRIAEMLNDSAAAVRRAVKQKVETGTEMRIHYDHPILFLQHMVWHEGYHHGQIKLALKVAGSPLSDSEVGPLTWGVWMRKS